MGIFEVTPDLAETAASRRSEESVRWFLVHAQNGREALAEMHLQRQGYRTFLPAMRRSVRHARQIRSVTSAFFPGYLFVALDMEVDRWRSIDGTIGVIRLVKSGATPLAAPQGLVEELIGTSNGEGVLDFTRRFNRGDVVRIVHGPFVGQLACVENLNGQDRVRVLLSLMNQTVPVEVRGRDLVKI